jgi:hypothetical protein
VLTGLYGKGLALLLRKNCRGRWAGSFGHLAKVLIRRWRLWRLVRVHTNTVPPNHDLKSEIFLQSCWLVAMASAEDTAPVNFLQKFVTGEPAALRHQTGAGCQQADHPWGVQALGPQPG